MPTPRQAADLPEPIILTFGSGLNSNVRPLDVDESECFAGYNFDLELDRLDFRRRKPFDLVTTAPNGSAILGYAQLYNTDGTVSTLIQAGAVVYQWDGATTFTAVGACSAAAKLRGERNSNFPLTGQVLITDITKAENVKTWDGSTYADLAHNLGGTLQAKFCHVHNERAIFANVSTSGIDTPQVILASALADPTDLSSGNRPSSSIGADAAWFLPVSDLKPINGLEHAFGQLVFSTANGSLHRLTGSSSFDYAVEDFYSGSGVAGDEAMANIGNDIILPVGPRIETLSGTINFGDVETDDISAWIKGDILNVSGWRTVYDRRLQRVYLFPDSLSKVYVLHKSLLSRGGRHSLNYDKRDIQSAGLSPWSVWSTSHSLNFTPSCVFQIQDPQSGLESVYMGDSSGHIYRMDGSGATDGGTDTITASRTSRIFRIPDAVEFDVEGWVTYSKNWAGTLTLTFLHGGIYQFDQAITLTLPADATIPVYNGTAYYSGTFYYSATFAARLTRQEFRAAGYSNHIQVRADITGSSDFSIAEIGLRFRVSRQSP